MTSNAYTNCMPEFTGEVPLQFHYGNVTFADFKKKFSVSTREWVQLKLWALPTGALEVARLVVAVAVGVIFGTLPAIFGDFTVFKVLTFLAVRNLQKTAGCLVTLFWLSYGQYHVLEAEAQANLYGEANKSEKPSPPKSPLSEKVLKEKKIAALETLGLKADVTGEREIEKAYKLKALKHHPDKDPEGLIKMQEINKAREFLKENNYFS